MKDPKFDINPHVIRQLGAELVTDQTTALMELVKNSYDADADYVKITINTKDVLNDPNLFYPNKKGYIIVEDNGFGMDEGTIINSWLVISFSNKRAVDGSKPKTPKGRTPLGDKGLGRLSTQRLAQVCEIYTKKENNKVKNNFTKVRTGRANAHVLDDIKVDYYGQLTPVTQLAGIKVPEASMLVIEPWDKSALKEIEKAIETSDLGITPSNDGASIRLPFPKPTEERRKELVKECGKYAEDAKVAIRNARRDANNKADRDEELTEDEVAREKKEIQKLTDEYVAKVEELLKNKTAEVMEI